MANTRIRLYIPVNATTHVVFSGLKEIYTADIQSATGIKSSAPANSTKIENVSISNFSSIAKLRVRVNTGTETDPVYKYGSIFSAPDKVDDILKGSLNGKTYRTKTITEAYIKRRRVYY